ncbi:putative acetyltransferase [Azospirillaceae bacterium]
MVIFPEQASHAVIIEALLDEAFGKARSTKTVYRLREGVSPVTDLCFVGLEGDRVVGAIRFWPVVIESKTPALLLGPIVVASDRRKVGYGGKLIRYGVECAAAFNHKVILLVGDVSYYERFGFSRRVTQALSLPGPVDEERFLGLELTPGALTGVSGRLMRWAPTACAA